MKTFYLWVRDLHLYAGLALAPFVILFAVSAILFNHPGLTNRQPAKRVTTLQGVLIPAAALQSTGMDQIETLRPVLFRVGVTGELGPVIYRKKEGRLIVTAMQPGHTSVLNVDLASGNATLESTRTGLRDALMYFHKYPGQHLAAIRGNSPHMRVWRVLADGGVYLLLFLIVSGLYLWAILKAERRTGLALLAAGFFVFALVVYGIVV